MHNKYNFLLHFSPAIYLFQHRLQIQLGDFGLACLLRSENHHSIIGTHMYAALEQLQGKCDPKVLFSSFAKIKFNIKFKIKI